MRAAWACVVVALWATSASAAEYESDQYGTEIPPKAFAHVPTRPFLEYERDALSVRALCGAGELPGYFEGCTKSTPQQIAALLVNPALPESDRADIMVKLAESPDLCVIYELRTIAPHLRGIRVHEYAHCNGLFHNSKTGHGWVEPGDLRMAAMQTKP